MATAVRWLRAWHEAGATAAKPRGGDRHSARIEAFGAVILAAVDRQVDITLVELVALLEREHGERFAPSAIWRFLDRRDLTFKKTAHASEQARPDCQTAPNIFHPTASKTFQFMWSVLAVSSSA